MKFKKITLLIGLLCLFTIQAQVNETPFSQFPETLTIEERQAGGAWVELAVTTATFNPDCTVDISTTSFEGSDTARTVYTYTPENPREVIVTQSYNVNAWVDVSRTENTYEGNNITEQTVSFKFGETWILSSKTVTTYNDSNQPMVDLFQIQDFGSGTLKDNNRIVYTYDAGLIKVELYQILNTMTAVWDDQERDTYTYSGSNVSEIVYDVWDGSDWKKDEIAVVIYNEDQQVEELTTSVWDDLVYVLDSKTLFSYINGLIKVLAEEDYNAAGNLENEIRSTYTYPTCASLSTSEYETFDFSFYPNPSDARIKLLDLPQEFSKVNYMLYDMSGRLVQSDKLSADHTISTQFLTNGLYVLKLRANSNSITKPLFVKH